jgi:hypothetical protein
MTIQMFAFFMRTGRHVLIVGAFRIASHNSLPRVPPEVVESEMDLPHWFEVMKIATEIEEK